MSRKGLLLILVLILQPLYITLSATTPTITLSISQAMSAIPADGKQHPAIIISIKDSSGKPYPMPYPLNVTLSTSDEAVLQFKKTAKLEPAAYYTIVNASSDILNPGQVEITVSAEGYTSSKATFSVKPPIGIPKGVQLTILPDILKSGLPSRADLIITVVDSYGNPTIARDGFNITLTSSNPEIANTEIGVIKIRKGDTNIKTNIISTGEKGTTTITASLPNLKTDSATLRVDGPKPSKIYLWSPPKMIITEPRNFIFIGVLDASSKPFILETPLTIQLYNLNPNILVQDEVTIEAGKWGKFIDINAFKIGTAKISAVKENMTLVTTQFTAINDPNTTVTGLKLTPISPSFPANGESAAILYLQTVDASGNPTHGLARDINVYSSNNAIIEMTPTQLGNIHTIAPGYTYKLLNGTIFASSAATISAISQYWTSAQVTVTGYTPLPDKIDIQTPPITTGTKVEGILVATKGGIPTPALLDTQLNLDSSNTDIGQTTPKITLQKKSYTARVEVNGISEGQFTITATTTGMDPITIQKKVIESRPATFTITYLKPLVDYSSPIIIQLGSSGNPTVTYSPIKVSLSSSNPSAMSLPSEATIDAEATEALIYVTPKTIQPNTITTTCTNFRSSTTTITANQVKLAVTLTVGIRYVKGETAEIKAAVTLNDAPIRGINVVWRGQGLTLNNTLTEANGEAANTLTVKQGINKISASIKAGGSYITTEKTITGTLSSYTLEVKANQPVEVRGSGVYNYGTQVHIVAPQSSKMEGIMGILGGKYVFKQWMGDLTATPNDMFYEISGEKSPLTIEAIYETDTTMPLIIGSVIVIIIIGAALVYFLRFRERELPSP